MISAVYSYLYDILSLSLSLSLSELVFSCVFYFFLSHCFLISLATLKLLSPFFNLTILTTTSPITITSSIFIINTSTITITTTITIIVTPKCRHQTRPSLAPVHSPVTPTPTPTTTPTHPSQLQGRGNESVSCGSLLNHPSIHPSRYSLR